MGRQLAELTESSASTQVFDIPRSVIVWLLYDGASPLTPRCPAASMNGRFHEIKNDVCSKRRNKGTRETRPAKTARWYVLLHISKENKR